jgi:glycosyltransferase involved in cell wall biosynthesis
MKLVSVTRILNEDDIVEAFVRHNARSVGHMVFLDNGSTDSTLPILRALKEEGIALSVFQSVAATFEEVPFNTWLYRLADQLHHADWVIFLDADEFVATESDSHLAAILAARTPHDQAVTLALRHYFDVAEDDQSEPIVPVRMRWRMRAPTGVVKLIVRGGLQTRLTVDAGNHGGFLDGRMLAAPLEPAATLAHFPRRSGIQNLQKIAIGWLKVLAAGEAARAEGWSSHYRSPFETVRDKPHELIGNPLYLTPGVDRSIAEDAPLDYRGGALRYTTRGDPAMKAIEVGMRYAEQLARQHGRLLDQFPEARHSHAATAAERKFLF